MKKYLLLALFAGSLQANPWPLPDLGKAPGAGTAADPATYPDPEGFAKRREALLEALASNDLSKWRTGYFSGGDPGKYLPGPAMARLLINPDDTEARKYMNDERSPKENYHFAALNWARFRPMFSDALTDETKRKLAGEAAKYGAYLNPSGTENHKIMNLTAAAVLPHYLEGGRIAFKDGETALADVKERLRLYVKGLYEVGQGEWDSPTYLMFDLHGMLNVYDFSKDPEMRLIAAAALDWFAAGYALKYRSGIYVGPNQRGHYTHAFQSIGDQTGWLWWGGDARPRNLRDFYFAIHPATSGWRPNAVLTHIARKDLPGLPVTLQNRKPNYWYGSSAKKDPGFHPETLHVSPSFTMGSIWRGFGSQITRFQIVADSPEGPVTLTGGHPRKSDHTGKKLDEITYQDGGGRYDQTAQFGPLFINLSRIPDDEPVDFTFVSFPQGSQPEKIGNRWICPLGKAWIAVVPFTKASAVEALELTPKQQQDYDKALAAGKVPPTSPLQLIKITGRPSGFAVIAAEASDFPTAEAFAKWTEETYRFDLSRFESEVAVSVDAKKLGKFTVAHDADGRVAIVSGDEEGRVSGPGPVYSGPFVEQEGGILKVSDGKESYTVDFTGELPVYR